MFYLKHKDTGKYFNYDSEGNISWLEDSSDASWWARECDALFVQNLWNDAETIYDECLWAITYVVEE